MYTFNLYCYGHKMSVNKELNNLLSDWDIEFSKKIGNKTWEINFPYHGGQVAGDLYSCVFGTIVSDDDLNPDYIDTIRNSKESDYEEDYKTFLKSLMDELQSDNYLSFSLLEEEEAKSYKDLVHKLSEFLKSNKPCFYSVEASS